jgi:hypothetical protein
MTTFDKSEGRSQKAKGGRQITDGICEMGYGKCEM